ncbi:MAG: signal peptidase I [Actinomycetota bacterium]|nr:signal peptidase I [Actinomycetota bacterium]
MSESRDDGDPGAAPGGSRSTVVGSAGSGRHTEPRPQPRRNAGTKHHLPLWQEIIVLLLIALGLAILLKSLFVQAFYIPSASMRDTLVENDRILVEKPSYWFDGPERGDIVVFADPGGWLGQTVSPQNNPAQQALEFFGLYPTGNHLVKRVIGVGGDRVRCCDRRGRILVNGTPLDESAYLPPGTRPSQQTFDVQVPPGRLWVMGDNRTNSQDSRAHLGDAGGGFIPVDDVVGRVFVTVWPPDRAGFIGRPEAFDALERRPATGERG